MRPTTHSEGGVVSPYRDTASIPTCATPASHPLPRVSCAIGDGRVRVVRTMKTVFTVERLTRDAMGVERWTHLINIDAPAKDAPFNSDRDLLFALLNDIDVIRHGSVP